VLGYRAWPVILLGAFLVNLSTTYAVLSSLGIAAGNALEALAGAYLVKRFASGIHVFRRVADTFRFALCGAAATALAATVGTVNLVLSRLAEWPEFGPVWFTWWLGDLVGAIIVAPVLILLAAREHFSSRRMERIIFLAALMLVSFVVFGLDHLTLANRPIAFLLIPFLVWPALRFSQRETATGALLTSAIAVWGTLQGLGPFGHLPPAESLLFVQGFVGVIALTSLALGAAVVEAREAKEKLSHSYDTALEGWSRALEIRDKESEGHARRAADLTVRLARALGIGEKEVVRMRRGALLHNIGKISIPDGILFKPGPLTPYEEQIMRNHPVYAKELLHGTELEDVADIPYAHHEHWDGSGYPGGLQGTNIPLSARIFAVADAWDKLAYSRSPELKEGQILERLASLSGKQFDPDILRVFLKMMKKEHFLA
jgi:HD-GYP domain-containing protein (c-di-GMP phosphodiesterase class II)